MEEDYLLLILSATGLEHEAELFTTQLCDLLKELSFVDKRTEKPLCKISTFGESSAGAVVSSCYTLFLTFRNRFSQDEIFWTMDICFI